QAVGGVAGPLLGSVVSSLDSYQAVFLVTAGLLIINLVMLLSARKKVD
ncbi:MAG: multidrug transporter subunit MdtG, partial [Liquorilactobacillus nagelii]